MSSDSSPSSHLCLPFSISTWLWQAQWHLHTRIQSIRTLYVIFLVGCHDTLLCDDDDDDDVDDDDN